MTLHAGVFSRDWRAGCWGDRHAGPELRCAREKSVSAKTASVSCGQLTFVDLGFLFWGQGQVWGSECRALGRDGNVWFSVLGSIPASVAPRALGRSSPSRALPHPDYGVWGQGYSGPSCHSPASQVRARLPRDAWRPFPALRAEVPALVTSSGIFSVPKEATQLDPCPEKSFLKGRVEAGRGAASPEPPPCAPPVSRVVPLGPVSSPFASGLEFREPEL